MANFGTATKIDTELQRDNKLIFEFPSVDGGSVLFRTCPFFENPKISESQTANIIKYDVLGRTGNFFGYTGAKSKMLNLDFDLTLPHIVSTQTIELFSQPPIPLTKMEKKQDFFNKQKNKNSSNTRSTRYEAQRKELFEIINGAPLEPIKINPALGTAGIGSAVAQRFETTSSEYDLASNLNAYSKPFIYAQAVDMLLFWIKLIRSSVLNNHDYPSFGPPIIRLKFGLLYDYISCVATKYSISWDESAGYDVVTLLPNKISVSLTLAQVQRNKGTQREVEEGSYLDNTRRTRGEEVLYGWEDVLSQHPGMFLYQDR